MTSEDKDEDKDEATAPDELAAGVDRAVTDWQQQQNSARLWDGDASLWTGER